MVLPWAVGNTGLHGVLPPGPSRCTTGSGSPPTPSRPPSRPLTPSCRGGRCSPRRTSPGKQRAGGVVSWRGPRVTRSAPRRYKKILGKAKKFELDRHRVILCTCSCAASASLKNLNVRQILVDEAGMATEPETLIPLVSFSHTEKVSRGDADGAQGGQVRRGASDALVPLARGQNHPCPPGGSSRGPQAAAARGQERAAAKPGAGQVSLREVLQGRLPAGHAVPHGEPRCACLPRPPLRPPAFSWAQGGGQPVPGSRSSCSTRASAVSLPWSSTRRG